MLHKISHNFIFIYFVGGGENFCNLRLRNISCSLEDSVLDKSIVSLHVDASSFGVFGVEVFSFDVFGIGVSSTLT